MKLFLFAVLTVLLLIVACAPAPTAIPTASVTPTSIPAIAPTAIATTTPNPLPTDTPTVTPTSTATPETVFDPLPQSGMPNNWVYIDEEDFAWFGATASKGRLMGASSDSNGQLKITLFFLLSNGQQKTKTYSLSVSPNSPFGIGVDIYQETLPNRAVRGQVTQIAQTGSSKEAADRLNYYLKFLSKKGVDYVFANLHFNFGGNGLSVYGNRSEIWLTYTGY